LASNSERRVVITGIGLICSVGNTTGAVWQALLAGKSGVDRITAFDASAFACQIAAEVRDFDPFNSSRKKKSRRWAASFTSPSPRR
jgi:3-oxoacyl-[acyl-carrier-protein] synthase II